MTVSSREMFGLLVQREKFREIPWPVRLAMRKVVFSRYGVDKEVMAPTREDELLLAEHPDYKDYCLAMLDDLERKLGKGPWTVALYLQFIMVQEDWRLEWPAQFLGTTRSVVHTAA